MFATTPRYKEEFHSAFRARLPVAVRISIAVIKTIAKKETCEGKGLFLLPVPHYSPSLRKARAGAWRHELMQRPWRRVVY